GDDEAAEALFDRSLLAARRLGQPHVLARTLLMSAWAPSWVNDLSEAEVMFREALDAARSVEGGDAWAESRSLVGIASVISPSGDEEEALRVGLEALDVGEQAGQAFASAVANATVGASLRHLMRLDEGLEHMDAAIGTFRELGARWELASALGDRGAIYRLAGRLEEAERDAREAFVLCRDLRERSLVTLTAAELARILAARGDAASAHQVLSEPAAHLVDDEPASEAAWLNAQSLVALLEGDEVAARAKARAAIDAGAGTGGAANAQAAQVWWAGRLFGPEEVGGPRALSDAHDLLEHHHWLQALLEPDLAADLRG
ncbi:MAG: tetratricopeptide repeat protein, partial [Actinomycetota bacterium]|nr:tetratricopeptide repeat protein [Actinomycetota bacterium]